MLDDFVDCLLTVFVSRLVAIFVGCAVSSFFHSLLFLAVIQLCFSGYLFPITRCLSSASYIKYGRVRSSRTFIIRSNDRSVYRNFYDLYCNLIYSIYNEFVDLTMRIFLGLT